MECQCQPARVQHSDPTSSILTVRDTEAMTCSDLKMKPFLSLIALARLDLRPWP